MIPYVLWNCGVCIYTSVMSNHIMNTHLTNSSLVKSQIQRLNPFIINNFSSFNLIRKETNVNELWLEYFSFLKKTPVFGKSDKESTKVLTNIPLYTTEKTNCPTIYSFFVLATFVLIWDSISISQRKCSTHKTEVWETLLHFNISTINFSLCWTYCFLSEDL